MTSKGATIEDAAAHQGERLFCYRHPDRETYVRCGRCDRPICSRCAMQGPVGFRCRLCGASARDPLTSFTPGQVATGGGLALGAGLVSGLAGAIGLLGLCVALFAGGAAARAIRHRVGGYKRGPALYAMVFGGLLVGTLVGYAAVYGGLLWPFGALASTEGESMGSFMLQTVGWAMLVGLAACLGAQSRLR